MADVEKVKAKYYRLSMTDELRKVVSGLPIRDLREECHGDHVYMATGTIRDGPDERQATVRVTLAEDGRMEAEFSSDGVRSVSGFSTDEERDGFVRSVQEIVGVPGARRV